MRCLPASDIFQFHYGAINSLSTLNHHNLSKWNFNSTMVRLIEPRCRISSGIFWNFNSTMVRLIAHDARNINILCLFQFHYGAINRSVCQLSRPILSYFNSTMVRLIAEAKKVVGHNVYLFQFHYGAINSPLSWTPILRLYPISIPLWCD